MHLLFDLFPLHFGQDAYHGGAEYIIRLLEGLCARAPRDTLSVVCRERSGLDERLQHLCDQHALPTHEVHSMGQLQALLERGGFTRFYSGLPYAYTRLRLDTLDFFLTLHGLRFVELPTDPYAHVYATSLMERLKLRVIQCLPETYRQVHIRRFRQLLRVPCRRRVIFVASEHTRSAVCRYFPFVDASTLEVCYPPAASGVPGHAVARDILGETGVEPERYVLLISAQRWQKNALRAMLALDRVYHERPGETTKTLVLGVSPKHRFTPYLQHPERFVFHGYVDAQSLKQLYSAARFFVFPTLNEGFGYPPLECMQQGTAVVSAAVTSTPELYQDAVAYCDPLSVDDIGRQLRRFLDDPVLVAEFAKRGAHRVRCVAARQAEDFDRLCDLLLAPE